MKKSILISLISVLSVASVWAVSEPAHEHAHGHGAANASGSTVGMNRDMMGSMDMKMRQQMMMEHGSATAETSMADRRNKIHESQMGMREHMASHSKHEMSMNHAEMMKGAQ
jgi:hypothetical protein